jgi:pimeloyl-ACP methyl ester carboxylesterase
MQQRSNMLLCSQETQCGAPSSIVNMFLFKPPVSHPYQFANEVIRLQTSTGNKICATYIERPGAAINIVFSHGNAEDLNTAYRFMQQLSVLLDANVVGYDYSGYGSSTGMFRTCRVRCMRQASTHRQFHADVQQDTPARRTVTLTFVASSTTLLKCLTYPPSISSSMGDPWVVGRRATWLK